MEMKKEYKRYLQKTNSNKQGLQHKFKSLGYLKSNEIDQIFHEGHEKAFSEIDCLECANCCKTTSPIFEQDDIDRIAKYLNQKPGDFIQKFLHMDEDGDFVLNESPCTFLNKDNKCKIYDVRPKACREYPHTNRKQMEEILDITHENALLCPAVAKIMGEMNV